MRSKYIVYAALIAILMLLFTGCDALITNAFKTANLGQPDAATIKNQDAATLIQQAGVLAGSVSDTFIQTVISDPDTMKAVIETLEATVKDGTLAEAQAAQALILEIKLADVGADAVLDNLNAVVGQLASLLNSNEPANPQDIINMLLPADLANDKTKLADLIDNLDALANDVDTLAAKIVANGNEAVAGLDIGSIAQAAALVKFVEIVEPAEGYSKGDAVAKAVEELKNNPDEDPDAVAQKYFAAEPDIASLKNDTTLRTLFTAAGMINLLNIIGG